jgi:hypothetical protein
MGLAVMSRQRNVVTAHSRGLVGSRRMQAEVMPRRLRLLLRLGGGDPR